MRMEIDARGAETVQVALIFAGVAVDDGNVAGNAEFALYASLEDATGKKMGVADDAGWALARIEEMEKGLSTFLRAVGTGDDVFDANAEIGHRLKKSAVPVHHPCGGEAGFDIDNVAVAEVEEMARGEIAGAKIVVRDDGDGESADGRTDDDMRAALTKGLDLVDGIEDGIDEKSIDAVIEKLVRPLDHAPEMPLPDLDEGRIVGRLNLGDHCQE